MWDLEKKLLLLINCHRHGRLRNPWLLIGLLKHHKVCVQILGREKKHKFKVFKGYICVVIVKFKKNKLCHRFEC